MEEFLTGDIWEEVNKRLTKGQKIACIAYVTSDKLKLSKGDTLICDASNFAIKYGETSAKTLEEYFNKGVEIFSNQQLHSKILLTDKFLVIGSANLSKNSAEKLVESSIITYSKSLISQAQAFCFNLEEESRLLKKEDIQKLLKIEVVKRPPRPTSKSKVRQQLFGDSSWFAPAEDISDKMWNEIEDNVEKSIKSISETLKIENVTSFTLRNSEWKNFRENVKEGNQIIFKFPDCFYSPVTILKIEKQLDDKYTHFYYKEEKKISHKKFQKSIESMNLENKNFNRVRRIKKNDMKELAQLWNKNTSK